jgi:hypothetical protein
VNEWEDFALELVSTTNGCNSTIFESFAFIIGRVLAFPLADEPSSTSSKLGDVERIVSPTDMVLQIVGWGVGVGDLFQTQMGKKIRQTFFSRPPNQKEKQCQCRGWLEWRLAAPAPALACARGLLLFVRLFGAETKTVCMIGYHT